MGDSVSVNLNHKALLKCCEDSICFVIIFTTQNDWLQQVSGYHCQASVVLLLLQAITLVA